mmetsp:Transcript_20740/g.35361  ORF Transcript_20740/g.35361 Transcript_20740/m.35361 type:complete len:99 (+) Transcript_20740:1158-1454(+)
MLHSLPHCNNPLIALFLPGGKIYGCVDVPIHLELYKSPKTHDIMDHSCAHKSSPSTTNQDKQYDHPTTHSNRSEQQSSATTACSIRDGFWRKCTRIVC